MAVNDFDKLFRLFIGSGPVTKRKTKKKNSPPLKFISLLGGFVYRTHHRVIIDT